MKNDFHRKLEEKLKRNLSDVDEYLTVELAPFLYESITTFGQGGCFSIGVTEGGCEREVQLWADETESFALGRQPKALRELKRELNEEDVDMLVALICEWHAIKARLLAEKENTERAIKAIERFEV